MVMHMDRMDTIIINRKFQVSGFKLVLSKLNLESGTKQGANAPFFMTNHFQITSASDSDLSLIIQGIKELTLDDIDLKREQFLVAKVGTKVIGFGRIKVYPDALELCSLGVLPEYRGRGIGKELVNELIKKANRQAIFVVCIIPDFFRRFGFEATHIYPDSLKVKINYCTGTLGGCDDGQEYVVMRKNVV